VVQKPANANYCGTVIRISKLVPLDNCDNVVAAIIFGNSVIVGNNVKVGDLGVFFPIETQLSEEFLKENSLYRKTELTLTQIKKATLKRTVVFVRSSSEVTSLRAYGYLSFALTISSTSRTQSYL